MAGIAGKLITLCVVVILVVIGYLAFAPGSEKEVAAMEDVPNFVEPALTDMELDVAQKDNFNIFNGPTLLKDDHVDEVTDTDSDGDGKLPYFYR